MASPKRNANGTLAVSVCAEAIPVAIVRTAAAMVSLVVVIFVSLHDCRNQPMVCGPHARALESPPTESGGQARSPAHRGRCALPFPPLAEPVVQESSEGDGAMALVARAHQPDIGDQGVLFASDSAGGERQYRLGSTAP